MTRAALVMACVAAAAALAGGAILARPVRTEPGVYAKRIAGTMFCALALILALFAWGLEKIASS